jgi:predicted NBD/HSP70 family sugar kinase
VILLGIDIGRSGINRAPVDTARGRRTQERDRVETPQPRTVPAVLDRVGMGNEAGIIGAATLAAAGVRRRRTAAVVR